MPWRCNVFRGPLCLPRTPPSTRSPNTPITPSVQMAPAQFISDQAVSVGIQTFLIQTDRNELTVAVLQAVSALRPLTTDAASVTEYTRVGDHFSREFVASLSTTDQHLSVLIDYLARPLPESAKAKIRSKLPSHWTTVLPSLHTSDGLLFLDERLVLPHCRQQPVLSLFHSTHAGARAMLSMAEFVWFPRMVPEIQCIARICLACTRTG